MSIRQMIEERTTGDEHFDVLFIGRVHALHELGGGPGGQTFAKLRVRVHPVGFAPERTRVRFYKDPPGSSLVPNFEFHRGRRYAVVAHRKNTGVFTFDGACGQTAGLSRHRMRNLIHLFWHS